MRQRHLNSILTAVQILTAGTLFAIPIACVQGQSKESKPTNQADPPTVEILTPTEGVDFSAFLAHSMQIVRRNWYALMPELAIQGEKGKVILRLQIQKDGALKSRTPTVELGSGKKPLYRAAIAAIRASMPFEHLPESFHGPSIELRIIFLYNLSAAPAQHP
jgi:hypothetical protein